MSVVLIEQRCYELYVLVQIAGGFKRIELIRIFGFSNTKQAIFNTITVDFLV